jgi:hypothetical protein
VVTTLVRCYYLLSFIAYLGTSLDHLAKFLNPADFNMVLRARDVITDSVMAEITQENPDGRTEFENAVRFHVISFAQRISVCLLVLDKLMEVFNSSRASSN